MTKRIDGKIGSVIDLGLVRYLSHARDLYEFYQNYEDGFLNMLCKEYSKISGQELTLKDVKIQSVAIRVSQVKDCLESDSAKMRSRIPGLLKLIAKTKNTLPEIKDNSPAKTVHAKQLKH